MSNRGVKYMHASCYLAIAIAYTIAVVAYAVLAFAAFGEERGGHAAEAPAATAPGDPAEPVIMLAQNA
jgi:hypothetical protein